MTVIPAHIIWLLERRHADSMVSQVLLPRDLPGLRLGAGNAGRPADDAPRHWQTRALGVLWAFVSIIFVAYYTATLTANLTVEKFDAQITSPADLVGKTGVHGRRHHLGDISCASSAVTYTGVPTIDDCYAGLKKGDFEAVVFDAPVLQYYVAHDGAGMARLAGPVFHHEDYGIAFPLGSELRQQADDALLSIREDGDYDLIKQKWFGDDAHSAGQPG